MASLFEGDPQQATSYVTSTSESPKWMQDAIFNQINWATNVAQTPFQTYDMPRVAELSPLQQQAYQTVQDNQGFWQGAMDDAQKGAFDLSGKETAGALGAAQGKFLRDDLVGANLEAGQDLFNRAGAMDITGAAMPYMDRASGATTAAITGRALSSASPYLVAASQSAADQVGRYMSPYKEGVLDLIARLGGENLRENILPNVSDTFIKAGQFGSSRMGEMGSRAIRDTQRAVLDAQSQAAQQGYGQAMSAAQADLARQAGLAGTAGSLSAQDLSRILAGGAQYGQLASQAGQLTAEQMRQLGALASARTSAGQAQQQFGLNAAQAEQQARAEDYSRQLSALQQFAAMQQQEQGMRAADAAALEAAGQAQQAQRQKELDASYQQFMDEQNYPKQQLDWLNTQIRGMAPITPQVDTKTGTTTGETYSPSILSQLAAGALTVKGLNS